MTRFTAIIALALVCLFGLAQADPFYFGICSCFNPSYDASCCILAKGSMTGNVCQTGNEHSTVKAYKKCCLGSGGYAKCKSGARADGIRPYWDGEYNCTSNPTITP
ncbi:hypothetical protein K450DRAFT_288681 [Umbelopsis ramanniana AG]|uniref:Uncharacterized protein n=1 Tax=Umbelopsis ramanniana AG TaxID=1314678 RepID=A0AAD5HEL4_UMBRA|nr:uncharacterized protein K450DRAFT_288681 [Umbelopsis ramanniana AG]KAI8579108.1 hypothetical protein K450DRAFT_288681 [Umbelopsis ramanniana AG]